MCADRSFARRFASVSSFRRVLLVAGVCLAVTLAAVSAHAAAYTVSVLTNASTGNECATSGTLCYAITQSDANPPTTGSNTINVTATGTITLAAALPAITQNTTITGPGANALTISGANTYQVFSLTGGTDAISGLTIANGASSAGGAGIAVAGTATLALTGSVLAYNVDSSITGGGGIFNNSNTLTVSDCTFYGNSTKGDGGAIYSVVPLAVTNSTFYGNSASLDGGAIEVSDSTAGDTLTVTNNTFSENSAVNRGGAIYSSIAAWTETNNIFANNSGLQYGGIYNDKTSTSGGESYNLFFNNSNGDSGSGNATVALAGSDVSGSDPLLLPLGNYGGTTPTMLPRPKSPAIGRGTSTGITTDQRGWPLSSPLDIGAVQTNYTQPTALASSYSGDEDLDLSKLSSPAANTAVIISGGAVNLIGPGADKLTFKGIGVSSDFDVDSGAQAVFYGMTISGGGGSGGGGVFSEGTATVLDSAITGNSVGDSSIVGLGGGVFNDGGVLTIIGSTISNNTAVGSSSLSSAGGGIYNANGSLTMIDSTVSGNAAPGGDGGGIENTATTTLTNVTVSNNNSTTGGGINATSGTLTVTNSIVAGNTGGDCAGSGCPANGTGGNLIGGTVNLATLASNGGPTETMLPIPGAGTSAICAGEKSLAVDQYGLALTTDQRGFPVGASTYCASGTGAGTIDSGAVQTNYTSIQFANLGSSTGYSSDKGLAVSVPAAPIVSVTENGLSAAGVPLTLAFSGTATGVGAGTSGTAYSNIVVNATGSGTLTASVPVTSSTTLTASTGLTIVNPVSATVAVSSKTLTANQPSANFTPVTGSGGAGTLIYSIAPALPTGLSIDSTAGTITGVPIPATTPVTTAYTVTITDGSGATATGTFALTVNSPVSATAAGLTETLTMGHAATSFTPVTATGGTGALTYTITPTLPTGLGIDSTTGTISGTPSVVSAQTTYTVTATDTNQATASGTFKLTVSGGVTTTVAVSSETLTAKQVAPPFTPVTATGGTAPLSYSVSPALPTGLTMASGTGAITGTPTVASTATPYTVTVTDANQATATASFSLTVNAAVTATPAIPTEALTVGQPSASFTPVTGSGGTGTLSYSVSPNLPAGLSFSTTTGAITGVPTAASAAATYTVTVKDSNDATATASFTLTVNAVVTATVAVSSESLTANQAATSFTPVTGGGGTTPLSYSVSPSLPAGLSFSTTTGAITGTPTAASAAANYTVTVKDTNGATATASFSLTVNAAIAATVAVPTETLTMNHAASFAPVTGAGGTAPLTYSVLPTVLPAGLSLNSSTGVISGTASATSAVTNYTVTVKDANGATATGSFLLSVSSAVAATVAVPTETLTANQPATSFTPVTGAGGTGSLSYSVSPALPGGLSISSTTGTISGTPTAASATATYTVTVTDTNGATATAGFSLTVSGSVTTVVAVPTETLTVNHAASFTPVTGSGGTGSLSYSVAPGLPAGLSIDSATGAISGTATATSAATNYTVTIKDTNGATATANFSMTVNASVTATQVVSSKTLTTNQPATSFTPVTGAGGTAPLSYSVSPNLPVGLSISSTSGAISGTPSAASPTATYTVTVKDANGATATASFSLTASGAVSAATAVPSRTLTASQSSAGYTPVAGSGGTGSLSYSVSPALPAGLSLSAATGAISGTPSAASTATTYTVTVTDTNNATATASFSLAVNAAVAAAQTIPTETLAVNQQASFTPVTGSGGTVPLTYSVSPALPTGLSLDSSTGQITGAHTSVSAATTYTVTVTDANQVAASASFTLAVSSAQTSVAISSSSTGNRSQVNDAVTFMATITPFIGNTALTPPFPGNAAQVTGSVAFEDNGNALCTASVSLTGGIYEATCTTSKLQATPSSHTITATYSGDANYSGSNSNLTQVVSAASSSMSLTASPNPSVVENPKNADDVVNLTATVSPSNGGVPLSGTVAFTDNGIAINGCTAIPVNASTGLATCSSTFSTFGAHSIVAVYGNDSNYISSQGTATQQVEDYSLSALPTTTINVTQGSTNTNDPFTPQPISVSAESFGGFTGNVALTCTVAAVATTQGAVLPTCSLGATNLAIASGAASQPVAVTISTGSGSTLASPGTYNVFVTGVDAATGLTHATAALTVDVRYNAPPITMTSGATTGNTSGLNFVLPSGVGITSFQCSTVTGPTLSVSVNPSGLGMGCAFNPSSIAAAGSAQTGSTTLTLSTNVPLSQAKLNHNSEFGGGSAIEVAGMIGVPLFMLLGFLPGIRRTRKIFFRYLGIVLVAVLLFGGISGCGGGSFTAPTQATGTTPPGTYNVLVQGAGTDGHTYEAVVTVNVTR